MNLQSFPKISFLLFLSQVDILCILEPRLLLDDPRLAVDASAHVPNHTEALAPLSILHAILRASKKPQPLVDNGLLFQHHQFLFLFLILLGSFQNCFLREPFLSLSFFSLSPQTVI
jgi:hypothetical protein